MTRGVSADSPALRMEGVSKRFPGTLAVDEVDFEARAGEVHALMGENGAGKSTLMKILAGSYDDYRGRIAINGREVGLHSPAAARAHGIGMIYQELSLARPISIAENLLVGHLPGAGASPSTAAPCGARLGAAWSGWGCGSTRPCRWRPSASTRRSWWRSPRRWARGRTSW